MCGHHAASASLPRKEPPVFTRQDAGWVPKLVSVVAKRKIPAPARN